MTARGTYGFTVDRSDRLECTRENTRRLRRLLLDWQIIDGDGGPGANQGDNGSWHLFCHLAAAASFYKLPGKGGAWVGIGFDVARHRYVAMVYGWRGGRLHSHPLASSAATSLLQGSKWCGFLEGASRGRIMDRNANDPGDPSSDDRRQDYDQNPNSSADGGPVWEMWSTSRNIVQPRSIGHELVPAYLELLASLGGPFAAVVARGRSEAEYGQLRQMCAMIEAGAITQEDALVEMPAKAIPKNVEDMLLHATPEVFARAATALAHATARPAYFMYERKVSSYTPASLLRRLVTALGSG